MWFQLDFILHFIELFFLFDLRKVSNDLSIVLALSFKFWEALHLFVLVV